MATVHIASLNDIFVIDDVFDTTEELADCVSRLLEQKSVTHVVGHVEITSKKNEYIFHIDTLTCKIDMQYSNLLFVSTIILNGYELSKGIDTAIRTKLETIFNFTVVATMDSVGGLFRMCTTKAISCILVDKPTFSTVYQMPLDVTFADRSMQEVMSGYFQSQHYFLECIQIEK